jgi:iron complex outermembrane recepter protein
MLKPFFIRPTALAVAVVPFLVSAEALAQDAFQGRTLEEIVVTSQKRAENLQDVPIAVSAFSGEDLRKFGVSDPQALQNTTPGLVFNNSGSFTQPYLRGVGSRLLANSVEGSVATYVDNRYVARPAAGVFEFADIERVEVLKGPQGTLYGRNATGGAIRVVTKDVAEELEGELTTGVGNYGYTSVSGTLSLPFTETFGGRFTVLNKQRDGYATNLYEPGIDELDDLDFEAYRAKLRWDISDRVTSSLSLSYWEKDDLRGNDIVNLSPPGLNVGDFLGGVFGRDQDHVGTAITQTDNGDEFAGELEIKVAFDAFDFVSISNYSDLKMNVTTDGDGTSANALDAFVKDNDEAFSQEFQLVSNGNTSLDWVLGAYLYQSEGQMELLVDVPTFPVLLSQGDQEATTDAWAVFGQATWHMNDRWALTLGGRYSAEEKEVEATGSQVAPITAPVFPFNDSADWTEFTPKVTLEYNLDNNLIYLTYARGFKSGGYNYPAIAALATGVLDPEILDMFELGTKGTFLDDRLRLNTSIYFYDYQDLQVTRAATGTGVPTTENAANAEVLGLDMDLTWLVTDALTITAGFNLLDTEYTDYPATAKVFNAVLTGLPVPGMRDVPYDASGENLLRAPDWSGFVSTEYVIPLAEGAVPIILSYSYKDDYNFDFIADESSQPLKQDAYGLLSARIGYVSGDQRLSFGLWGNNLTDEEYFDDIVGNALGLRGSWGAPRTYGADVTFRF